MLKQCDVLFLQKAIEASFGGVGKTHPNPPVGAVIVADNEIIGTGCHMRAGEDHAEVIAIRDAIKKGYKTKGATLYVSLEPCSKPGRVGACTDAIIKAGISRVVYAVADPSPKNHGGAKAALKKAKIKCISAEDEIAENDSRFELITNARALVAPFAKHQKTGMPYVTVKIAMSLDGKICDNSGYSKWISSEKSRVEVDLLRSRVDAIMVGAETIRKDNPTLLPRRLEKPDLIRVVISKSGNLPKNAKVFTDGKNETLVFSSPEEALIELGKRGCLHVLCEGGFTLARSLAALGFVDDWVTYLAPIVIGDQPLEKAFRLNGDRGEDCVYWADTKDWNR